MLSIAHDTVRSGKIIIGSAVVTFDEIGIAEVSQETYDSVAGLKGYTQIEKKITGGANKTPPVVKRKAK